MNGTILVGDPLVYDLFVAEDKTILNKRAVYTVEKTDKGVLFTIQAKDATAFRATQNAICKLLVIHEKMKTIQ